MKRSKLNFLIAYPYTNDRVLAVYRERSRDVRLLIDSGAFSAWRIGTTITLDEYCKFLESLRPAPWRYFMLDVIGDPVATMKNYSIMLKRGFNPIPVFTRGSPPAMIDELYQTSDVIGIGGLVGTRRSEGFINGAMKLIAGRKAHWLGFMRLDYIKHWRPFSCDATNFNRGSRYGWCDVYTGDGQMPHVNRPTFKRQHLTQKIAAAITRYGFDPYQLATPAGWDGPEAPARLVPYYSWVEFSADAERELGTKVFLAGNPSDLEVMLTVKEKLKC